MLNIAGLDKAQLLISLYEKARPIKQTSLLSALYPADTRFKLTHEKANEILQKNPVIYAINGKILDINLSTDSVNFSNYEYNNAIDVEKEILMIMREPLGHPCHQEEQTNNTP